MWRGKSEGDKNDTQGRTGPGQARPRANARQGQRGPEGAAPGGRDPRSRATGKKIRRIESGTSVPGQGQVPGPGPAGSRRRTGPGGQPLAPRGAGPQGDPTDIGRAPNGPPRRNQPFEGAGRGPGLPPLTQPTGEIPKVPSDLSPDDTVVVTSPQAPDSVFGGAPSAAADQMPSALPPMGEAAEAVSDATGAMPAFADRAAGAATGAMPAARRPGAPPQMPPGQPGLPPVDEHALTDPFPAAQADFGARPSGSAAPQTQAFDSRSMAAAAAVGAPVDARAAARASREQAAFGSPVDVGRLAQRRGGPGAGPRSDRGFETKQSDRLQDTEFKLSDKRRKQKPKEPNKLLLGLAMALVVLVGVAVAFFLTRGGDDATTETANAPVQTEAGADDDGEAEPLSDTVAPTDTPAEPEPVVDVPTLFFDEAQAAPLQQGQTYSIDLVGEPEGSLLQVVVDDIPQGQPDAVLPDLILPAGRHSLYIQISNGAEVSQSTPVDVYVLGPEPAKGFRANLSSVDIQNEGWAEAIRQFDEYRAAGHEGLQLAPLSPGYWNIFVGGLGEDSAAVQTYCESFSLAVPDQCFGAYYEPTGGATDGTATDGTTDTTAGATTETTVEAMTDEDGSTTTSAAGG